ncbi:MAG: D-lyxose/D-mannose family sugar isomerase [Candidatus Dormibacteraceae bacterium]
MTEQEHDQVRSEALAMLSASGIALRSNEAGAVEVADFGLGRIREIGLELFVYVNTERCCAKELVLLPRQMCPEHRHPPVGDYPGKEETFRCRSGQVYLYIPGTAVNKPAAKPPQDQALHLTVWHEIALGPGDQWTIPPDTPHWFQAGDAGAVVSEFSTKSMDEHDIFTDPGVERMTRVSDNEATE